MADALAVVLSFILAVVVIVLIFIPLIIIGIAAMIIIAVVAFIMFIATIIGEIYNEIKKFFSKKIKQRKI